MDRFTEGFEQGDTTWTWTCTCCGQRTDDPNIIWQGWIADHRHFCPGKLPKVMADNPPPAMPTAAD